MPLLFSVSCSVWAQMAGPSAAAKQRQQSQAAERTSQQSARPANTQQTRTANRQVQFVQPQQPQQQNAQASQQQQVVSVSGNSGVPVTTVVPVQQQPASVVSYTTVMEPQPMRMTRAHRRAYKAEKFACSLDSLIRSRNFVFYPSTMQETPDGSMAYIVADHFYFGMFNDSAEVHLPTLNGSLDFIRMLNFDSFVSDLRLYPYPSGLNITFALHNNGKDYFTRLVVSTVTGECVLMLATPETTMRYVGWVSAVKLHEE